jgi:hypothetical protein
MVHEYTERCISTRLSPHLYRSRPEPKYLRPSASRKAVEIHQHMHTIRGNPFSRFPVCQISQVDKPPPCLGTSPAPAAAPAAVTPTKL